MPGQLRDEQPATREEQRRERQPVRGRSAEAVYQHERSTGTRDEVTQTGTARLGEALLEPRKLAEALLATPTMRGRGGFADVSVFLCVRHGPRLFLEAMDRSGRQDP